MARNPSASYSLTMRLEIPSAAGSFALVAAAVAEAEGDMGAIDLVRVAKDTRSATSPSRPRTATHGAAHHRQGRGVARRDAGERQRPHLPACTWAARSRSATKVPIKTRDDLSMAYTPGVARVCMAIAADPEKAATLTIKQNTVAVVTDGTAVLGLGDIGPGGGHAGDGGQGHAVQGVRRHRRLADLPRHQGHRRDRRHREGDRARLRRHQPRGHRRPALLRDRGAAARRSSTSPSSTTTSTARRWWCWPACSTPPSSSASAWTT